ncbi:N-acetylglucosamine kinase [Microlunatus endophyticus]|uniref:N-acetylglucosamine kinase n=1 Tax=Microlunatus endophyticus TaxID=1716077 RepID=A0A917S3T9_9ACTN|nr:BadF/BadG/BcrA/BcrD ATPase family protein [Microlunatus endophyticus]GGL55713.1 N-acetylglucosamine kinase [Microlunatus endophyticus]
MKRVVLGADVGGTSTRVGVADLTGSVLAVTRETGGNPNAVGLETSAARIRTATSRALEQAGVEPSAVAAVVLGMAGYNTATSAGPGFLHTSLGAAAAVSRIVSDLGVAYASGSPLAHGYVVIAGTGSAAAEIDHGEMICRRGGWGWLLGDEGGAFWLGREAVRLALTEVQAGVRRSDLTRQVIDRLDGHGLDTGGLDTDGLHADRSLASLLRLPYDRPPIALAELAPLVTRLVDSDPAAASIAARAADILTGLVLDLDPRPGLPVVATGSVLLSARPIRQAFTDRIDISLGSPVLTATSGLVGALWLALGDLDHVPDPVVHDRLAGTLAGLEQPAE